LLAIRKNDKKSSVGNGSVIAFKFVSKFTPGTYS